MPATEDPTPPLANSAAAPLQIEGLDTAAGLRRVLGKPAQYLSLLRKFVETQPGTFEELRAALAQDDKALAERLAHTLKGTCGNIGAGRLQALAAEIEAAVHGGADTRDTELMLERFAAPFEELLGRIRSAVAETRFGAETGAAHADVQPVTKETQERIVRSLAALLADDDAEACEVFEAGEAPLRYVLGPQYAVLADALGKFDFPDALAVLSAAAGAAGISLSTEEESRDEPTQQS